MSFESTIAGMVLPKSYAPCRAPVMHSQEETMSSMGAVRPKQVWLLPEPSGLAVAGPRYTT